MESLNKVYSKNQRDGDIFFLFGVALEHELLFFFFFFFLVGPFNCLLD